jgi:hypothetical protein
MSDGAGSYVEQLRREPIRSSAQEKTLQVAPTRQRQPRPLNVAAGSSRCGVATTPEHLSDVTAIKVHAPSVFHNPPELFQKTFTHFNTFHQLLSRTAVSDCGFAVLMILFTHNGQDVLLVPACCTQSP